MAIIASIALGGLFGSASATIEEIDSQAMLVDLEVEVSPSLVGSVVAHMLFEDEPDLTLPMLDRGDGVYGVRSELEPKNYFVVFEIIGEQGGLSDPVSLADMGADPITGQGVTTNAPDEGEGDSGSFQTLWLAGALAAASLSALAFWVLGGREEEKDHDRDAAEPVGVSEEE